MKALFETLKQDLTNSPKTWLVTGAAGFIGSSLLEDLLQLGQKVVALDNFATGYRHNLADVQARVGGAWDVNCRFVEGDITDADCCREVCRDVDYVLHQAALGSVPRSIENPRETNRVNVDGFVNMLIAARDAAVKRFVYASSSSVYGDSPDSPKVEERTGLLLSPYAASKKVNEIYAQVFTAAYGMETIGLRYFNVFGPRQDPKGAYAAVIPCWLDSITRGRPGTIHGDDSITRDFCFIANVVQANMLAATAVDPAAVNQVYNIAYGEQTSLKELYAMICEHIAKVSGRQVEAAPQIGPGRPGDIKHSLADISKARKLLGYDPKYDLRDGMALLARWFLDPRRASLAL